MIDRAQRIQLFLLQTVRTDPQGFVSQAEVEAGVGVKAVSRLLNEMIKEDGIECEDCAVRGPRKRLKGYRLTDLGRRGAEATLAALLDVGIVLPDGTTLTGREVLGAASTHEELLPRIVARMRDRPEARTADELFSDAAPGKVEDGEDAATRGFDSFCRMLGIAPDDLETQAPANLQIVADLADVLLERGRSEVSAGTEDDAFLLATRVMWALYQRGHFTPVVLGVDDLLRPLPRAVLLARLFPFHSAVLVWGARRVSPADAARVEEILAAVARERDRFDCLILVAHVVETAPREVPIVSPGEPVRGEAER